MTRALLDGWLRARGSFETRAFGLCVVAALLPFALWADVVIGIVRRARLRRVLAVPVARCDRGHETVLWRAWTCPHCRLVTGGRTHGFGPCPHCGELSHASCVCGLPIRNPLVREP